ncbi:MAG: hypothetical protein Ta2C_09430 [Candidatus Endomicrobiellum trichonymphae]|uniref:restriction endonuclease subunit S n=1 Tax=Endomicrobium trichonymphae TaxID=1408204 RepID=UPI0027D43545|nr:MAG: hypothetical protein Ta2C_09430 [Candidatus Endomicrobium trichonymphae]
MRINSKWEVKKFEDCIDKIIYSVKMQKKDFLCKGKFPIISQESEFINGYSNDKKKLFKIEKPIIIFGGHTRVFKYIDFDFILGADGVKIIQPKGILYTKFLYYYLMNKPLKSLGYSRHYRKLKGVNVYYPNDISEQKKIVAKLDKFSENIKRLEYAARKNLQNAKDLFNSVLNETFKNKSAVVNDNRQVYKKAHWEVKKLGEVCDVLDSKRKPVAKKDRVRGRYPYYGSSGILDYVSQYIFNERLVLIGEDGAKWSIGEQTAFIAEGKYWVNNHAHVVRPHKDKLLDTWLVYYLNITDVSGYVNGLTVPKLNQERMKSITIPLLSISEQKKIVARLDKLSAETKKLEIVYQKKIDGLAELKKSVLKQTFDCG